MKFKILSLFLLISSLCSSPVYSMNWEDPMWKSSGCPATVSGQWVSDNPATSRHQLLSINKKNVAYSFENDESKYFDISEIHDLKGERYISMKLTPVENKDGKATIIKIRPHLVHARSKNQKGYCSIKVFNFETEQHAKTDRYSSWNIYRLKN